MLYKFLAVTNLGLVTLKILLGNLWTAAFNFAVFAMVVSCIKGDK